MWKDGCGWNHRRRTSFWFKVKCLLLAACAYLAVIRIYDGMRPPPEEQLRVDPARKQFVLPSRVGRMIEGNDNRTDATEPIAVLIFCATRAAAIENHLNQVIKQRPSAQAFPVYVSQDGHKEDVAEVVHKFMRDHENIHFMQHPSTAVGQKGKAYHNIASHYKWALDFVLANHSAAIITEDDLDIADDFFSYFSATRKLLDLDPSIWCISAWNDNGGNRLVDNNKPDQLYRTDFFPGLGWMVRATVWAELSQKWPVAYWDDFMRTAETRKNRVCIRPEVSRTRHNNRLAGKGSSNGQYKSFLEKIAVPKSPVDFSLIDINRLTQSNYDPAFRAQILQAKPITITQLLSTEPLDPQFAYRISFKDPREFRSFANPLTLMNDIRGGLIRTIYKGVLTFRHKECRIYAVMHSVDINKPFEDLVPDRDVYDEKWDKMSRFLDFEIGVCKKYSGKCDPYSPEMIDWIKKKHWVKKVANYGEMIVF